MSDGAKTGTRERMNTRRDGEVIVWMPVSEYDATLTEALKVAGEATKPITMSDVRLRCGEGKLLPGDVIKAVNSILLIREAALERIGNQSPT